MSTLLHMMVGGERRALSHRLERLTGEPAKVCLPRYLLTGSELARSPALEEAWQRFRALADRRRLLALFLLQRQADLCACEIQAVTGLTHPAVSYHMGILLNAGLVDSYRRGKWVRYRITREGERCLLRGVV